MVHWQVFVKHLLQVLPDVAQSQVQALQRLQLRGYTCGECTDCDVTDITEKVLDANLLCFFSFDDRGCVYECLGGCCAILQSISMRTNIHGLQTYILDLLYSKVGVCWHAHLLRLYVDND